MSKFILVKKTPFNTAKKTKGTMYTVKSGGRALTVSTLDFFAEDLKETAGFLEINVPVKAFKGGVDESGEPTLGRIVPKDDLEFEEE